MVQSLITFYFKQNYLWPTVNQSLASKANELTKLRWENYFFYIYQYYHHHGGKNQTFKRKLALYM